MLFPEPDDPSMPILLDWPSNCMFSWKVFVVFFRWISMGMFFSFFWGRGIFIVVFSGRRMQSVCVLILSPGFCNRRKIFPSLLPGVL